jgi:hypothetical protein
MRKLKVAAWVVVGLGVLMLMAWPGSDTPHALAQQPTGSVATVTGTPSGPVIRVDQSLQTIFIYAGPGSFDYPAIGVLLANETAPAIGRARGRDDWIQIYYPGVPGSVGWVWALQVGLSPGALLPLVDIPPTPTPLATPTLPEDLVEAFIGEQTPTRLPTFTPPPPIILPEFSDNTGNQTGFPAGLLIISLALFGFLGAVISYLRGR